MLDPLEAKLICSPSIRADCNHPGWRQLVEPDLVELLPFQNEEGWNKRAICTGSLDQCDPFRIRWLDLLWLAWPVCSCDYLRGRYLSHLEASLIEVIGVFRQDAILVDCVLHQSEPLLNDCWIFTQLPLAFICSSLLYS